MSLKSGGVDLTPPRAELRRLFGVEKSDAIETMISAMIRKAAGEAPPDPRDVLLRALHNATAMLEDPGPDPEESERAARDLVRSAL